MAEWAIADKGGVRLQDERDFGLPAESVWPRVTAISGHTQLTRDRTCWVGAQRNFLVDIWGCNTGVARPGTTHAQRLYAGWWELKV